MVTNDGRESATAPRRLLIVGMLSLVILGAVAFSGFLSRIPLHAQVPVINKWQFEAIPVPPDIARLVSSGDVAGNLAIDSEGHVHLVFARQTLQYAVRDDSGWTFQTIGPGRDASLALDSSGKPHITYYDQDALHYAVLDNGNWAVKHSVDAAAPPYGLALDQNDRPHIAYISPGPDHNSPAYTTWDGKAWQESSVAPNRSISNVGIALNNQGNPTVVYDATYDSFVGASLAPDGTWQESTIVTLSHSSYIYELHPETMQVSADSGGRTLVSWAHGEAFIIKPPYTIYYTANLVGYDGSSADGLAGTAIPPLGYGSAAPSSVVHGPGLANDAFLAFIVDNDLWLSDSWPTTTGWQKIARAWDVTAPAVGPDGQPRIVFANSEGLWYGRRREVELSNQIFMPVIGNLWVGDWIATDPIGVTSAVWVDTLGHPASNNASHASISADSRYVALESTSLAGIRQQAPDIALIDRAFGTAQCISIDQAGACRSNAWSPVISADGRFVAFEAAAALLPSDSDSYGDFDIYLYDVPAATLSLVSEGGNLAQEDDDASFPSISADGRYVAYVQGRNGYGILVYDRQASLSTYLSDNPLPGADGAYTKYPVISADGLHVAFVYDHDLAAIGDRNGKSDIYLYDRQTGELALVSARSDGTQAEAHSYEPQISADGRFVTFTTAGDLSPEDTNGVSDIYRHDRQSGETIWISRNLTPPIGSSFAPTMSADGRLIAFESYANFGVAADRNSYNDVYLVEVGQTPELVSVDPNGVAGNSGSATPALSSDGRFIIFKSEADNLVLGDTNNQADIFFRRVR